MHLNLLWGIDAFQNSFHVRLYLVSAEAFVLPQALPSASLSRGTSELGPCGQVPGQASHGALPEAGPRQSELGIKSASVSRHSARHLPLPCSLHFLFSFLPLSNGGGVPVSTALMLDFLIVQGAPSRFLFFTCLIEVLESEIMSGLNMMTFGGFMKWDT